MNCDYRNITYYQIMNCCYFMCVFLLMKYNDIMNIECFLNYLRENEVILELLSSKKIIENNIENDRENKVKDNSYVLEFISHKDALKATIITYNFLKQHEKTILELLNAPRKVRN